jgi:hypothetical protein
MTTKITRFNKTRTGYNKAGDIEFSNSQQGQDDFNAYIAKVVNAKTASRAISFGLYEDGQHSGATWHSPTAIVLHYMIGDHGSRATTEIIPAARLLRLGFWCLATKDRYNHNCLAIALPLTASLTQEQYARLVYVLMEEMRALGCSYGLAKGTSAMTHVLEFGAGAEAAWVDGPLLDGKAKIKATKLAAQNMERDRFTVGHDAARVQLERPVFTACEPGLFEGL